jgi:BMFP domain-containing protein YqiC
MNKSNIKSLADNIENLMNTVKEMRKETKSAELRSVLKYVYNRLDLADTELYVYLDGDEDE